MADIYGLNADQVARLRRALIAGGVPDHDSYSRRSRRPPAWEPRLVVATTTIAAGGSGVFELRASTATGASETSYGSGLTAKDWTGTGASSGDKALAFKPYGSQWYFLKSGGGGATPPVIDYAVIRSTPSTRSATATGCTATDYVYAHPCTSADGQGRDSATTWILTMARQPIATPYVTTDTVVATMALGSERTIVSDYSAPNASFYVTNYEASTVNSGSTFKIVPLNDTPTGCHMHNWDWRDSGTTQAVLMPRYPGRYLVTSRVICSPVANTTGTYLARISVSTNTSPAAEPSIEERAFLVKAIGDTEGTNINRTTDLHFGQTCILNLTTASALHIALWAPGDNFHIAANAASLSATLLHPNVSTNL